MLITRAFFVSLTWLTVACASTVNRSQCFTSFGITPVSPIPTSNKVISASVPALVKAVVTPTVTVTPSPATSIITVYATATLTTTLSQITDTATLTSTIFNTQITTSTSTKTSATVSISIALSTPATLTIPTVPAFTPLATVVQSQGYTASKKKRSLRILPKALLRQKLRKPRGELQLGADNILTATPARHPTKVVCTQHVNLLSTSTTLLSVAAVTVTVTADTPTTTIQTTVLQTVTSTALLQDASTTLTILSTSSITSTSILTVTTTTTSLSTSTSILPVPTFYAACSANNLITTIAGSPVVYATMDNPNLVSTTANTAYDCCAACQQAGIGCASFVFQPNGACTFLLQLDNLCHGDVAVGSVRTNAIQAPPGIVYGDSGCGRLDYDDVNST